MKNYTLTLCFFLYTLASFGQPALSGSVLLQNNVQEYHFQTTSGSYRFEGDFRLLQLPSAAFSYFRFRESGHYTKWQLSGWRFNQVKDIDILYEDSTGLEEPLDGSDMIMAGGRIGFSKGWAGKTNNENLHFYIEGASNLQLQYIEVNPKTSQGYPRRVYAANIQLGPNIVLQRHFQRGFLSFAMLLPICQISLESMYYQNPSFTRRQQGTNNVSLDFQVWKRSGLEIGGGFFLSD